MTRRSSAFAVPGNSPIAHISPGKLPSNDAAAPGAVQKVPLGTFRQLGLPLADPTRRQRLSG